MQTAGLIGWTVLLEGLRRVYFRHQSLCCHWPKQDAKFVAWTACNCQELKNFYTAAHQPSLRTDRGHFRCLRDIVGGGWPCGVGIASSDGAAAALFERRSFACCLADHVPHSRRKGGSRPTPAVAPDSQTPAQSPICQSHLSHVRNSQEQEATRSYRDFKMSMPDEENNHKVSTPNRTPKEETQHECAPQPSLRSIWKMPRP